MLPSAIQCSMAVSHHHLDYSPSSKNLLGTNTLDSSIFIFIDFYSRTEFMNAALHSLVKANYIYSGNNYMIIFNHTVGDEALLSKILCIMHFVSSSMLRGAEAQVFGVH